jgi:formylglycine-generating enzyme required for sulfatase activity
LPGGLTNLLELNLFFNQLTNLTLPADLTNLTELNLDFNRFTSVNLPTNLTHLSFLRLRSNLFTNINLPTGLTALRYLDLGENQLSMLTLPPGLHHLEILRLSGNRFTSFTLAAGLTNLMVLFLPENQLTNLTLPSDLDHLETLNLGGNQLPGITLPSGLTNLRELVLTGNQVTNLTLPPDITQLVELDLAANPLSTLVLSEPLAVNLAETVATLRNQGVSVFTYPLMVQLVRLQNLNGAFQFAIAGPPGVYTVLDSTNLAAWHVLGTVPNPLGKVVFTDGTAHLSAQKYYRALQRTPANMVFIPPNIFTLGSPTNEVGHRSDESPQTIVTLSHGFWIGKLLVTQRDFLAVMGFNPSGFPGDLDRPVERVSWFDTSNYCAKLTEQDLAAGRIPPGSHYRLPTEAEWECAARAGTSTRFYYGDDPNVTSLTNYAWYGANSGFKPQPVGLKAPNAWGLYDMAGNVWEWCQDWYGPYPGGSVTDPQGAPSNAIGFKVIRGGAWESSDLDCRAARRSFEAAHPFIMDFIIGFRVVLAVDP